jgi:hypothetical protein
MPGQENLKELHYICPIANVPSIMRIGILSHKEARRLEHESAADQKIQDRREPKRVPRGLPLHHYVNLYFNARNAMLHKIQDKFFQLCVLRISLDILSLPGVVITDGNAASDYTSFGAYPEMLSRVSWDSVFAESWWSENQFDYWERKRAICAEVLIPHAVEPQYIIGAYVSCSDSVLKLRKLEFSLPALVNEHLFFGVRGML